MKLKASLILLLFLTALFLSGCYWVEANLDDTSEKNVPMSSLEYTNAVNGLIMPLLSDGETYLAHHLEIVKGNYPVAEEIVLVEKSISKVQSTIEAVSKINEPTSQEEHKAELILNLNTYKAALERYVEALETGEKDEIKPAADDIKSEFGTLKTSFGLVEMQ